MIARLLTPALTLVHTGGQFQYADLEKKPAIPDRREKPIMGLQSRKNYVSANAIDNILAGQLYCSLRDPGARSLSAYRCDWQFRSDQCRRCRTTS